MDTYMRYLRKRPRVNVCDRVKLSLKFFMTNLNIRLKRLNIRKKD